MVDINACHLHDARPIVSYVRGYGKSPVNWRPGNRRKDLSEEEATRGIVVAERLTMAC